MDKQLRRILNLVRKTGDRMVVTDSNGEDVYVVIGLDQYEELVSPVEDMGESDSGESWGEGWWEPGPEGDVPPVPPAVVEVADAPSDIWETMKPAGQDGETWDLDKMTEAEKVDLEKQYREYQKSKERVVEPTVQPVVPEIKKVEEKPKEDEDFGEEQFYLEPVE
ncbi:type II toxin-antitoxin system Phd/YefM family antitoxin [bacterium]|nr:type II toxin-antitoxin system Phd/YefM family antitoxin [bacterium]